MGWFDNDPSDLEWSTLDHMAKKYKGGDIKKSKAAWGDKDGSGGPMRGSAWLIVYGSVGFMLAAFKVVGLL